MSNEKKNPLIGAFRTPVAGAPPTPAPPIPAKETKPPILSPAAVKPGEVKKPAEPAKDDKVAKDGRPVAAPVTPAKPDEGKKPAEPAKDDKAAKDGKSATAPVTPAKPDEGKKPAELAKDDKAAKDGKPAAAPSAPVKLDESKKPSEPAKDDKAAKDGKPAAAPITPPKPDEVKKPAESAKDDKAAKDSKPAATLVTPAKPDEGKKPAESTKAAEPQKPTEQPKESTAVTRTADGPKGSAVTKVFEDRLDAPTEADFLKLPVPSEGEIYSMAVHPAYLKDFLDHPFTVNRETQDYKDLFESIKTYGIREPVLCRPGRNGGLEIISGHRRHDIGAQLNYPIPVLIERVDEDDAQIQCVDGNLHRKDIPISELARAAQMKMDALKRKAGRRSKADILAGKEPMKRSDEQVGEDLGMSRASVQRLMRVNQLEEPLKKMVDKKELPLDTAEQISHMKPTEQKTLADAIEKEGGKVPSKTEAVKLKEESRAGTLTTQKIEKSVAPTKREIDPPLKVTFQDDELRPYFPDKGTTVATVKRTMFEAMDLRKKALERQKMKMQTEKEPKKKSEPER